MPLYLDIASAWRKPPCLPVGRCFDAVTHQLYGRQLAVSTHGRRCGRLSFQCSVSWMHPALLRQQVELFPALRGGDVDWRTAANGGQQGAEYSAFLGDYAPVAAPAGGATADGNATPPQTTAAPVECVPSSSSGPPRNANIQCGAVMRTLEHLCLRVMVPARLSMLSAQRHRPGYACALFRPNVNIIDDCLTRGICSTTGRVHQPAPCTKNMLRCCNSPGQSTPCCTLFVAQVHKLAPGTTRSCPRRSGSGAPAACS